MAYASGSSGEIQEDGSTTFTIPNFVSPDSNYTVAVRIKDNSGNFVKEIRDSYTPVEVGDVVITDTLVDGIVTPGYEIKEIKTGAEVLIKVFGNGVAGTTFSATAVAGGTSLDLTAVNNNEFNWDISALNPGLYTVTITATNGSTTDTQEVVFKLYSTSTILLTRALTICPSVGTRESQASHLTLQMEHSPTEYPKADGIIFINPLNTQPLALSSMP